MLSLGQTGQQLVPSSFAAMRSVWEGLVYSSCSACPHDPWVIDSALSFP